MRLSELTVAIENARKILEKIRQKYPRIDVRLVLCNRYGYASVDSSLELLLDQTDHFFIENKSVKRAWVLLDLLYDKNEDLYAFKKEQRLGTGRKWQIQQLENHISALTAEYKSLIPLLEVHEDLEICLQWVEIDYEINKKLRHDSDLVDVSRTPQISGIKICLGTVKDLSTNNKGEK